MEAVPQSQSTAGRRSLTSIFEAASGRAPQPAPGCLRQALPVALALAAGLALRMWMLKSFFQADGDALIYGGLAKNLLWNGQYALNGANGEIYPTLIRLPGYPLFLALCFRIFGIENYASAAWVQIGLELVGCLLLADFAGRIAPVKLGTGSAGRRRAALATLWLAALCPFTAIYAAQPLTEALTLFTIALALWSAARFGERPAWSSALYFTVAVSFAALLRPDGALVGVALAPALVGALWHKAIPTAGDGVSKIANEQVGKPAKYLKQPGSADSLPRLFSGAGQPKAISPTAGGRMIAVCLLLALLPFAAWSWRNWKVFHVFEPLAPRYANDPDEESYPGWQRWIKTWCLDFACTYDVYWPVPCGSLDLSKVPSRAFDSPAEYAQTVQLAEEYNRNGQQISPQLDARFESLAGERIKAHPLRYYLWLPLGRLADMGLRPRVENLPIDLDWWVDAHHQAETRFSWAYAGLNVVYLLLGLAGLCIRPRLWPWLLAYIALRSALLMTVEAPEARYTLEYFPILFALGGIALSGAWRWIAEFLR
jgi:hypothetical protein